MKLRKSLIVVSLVTMSSAACWAVLAQPPGKAPPGFQGGRGGAFEPPRAPVMLAMDADSDGELSADEIVAAAESLKMLDKNGDGRLNREELRPQFAGRGGPGAPGGPGFGPPEGRGGREFGPPDGGGAPGFGPPGGPGAPEGGRQSSFRSETRGKDDGEVKILAALRDIQQKQGRRMNVPDADGRLLRLLAESLGAKTVVEFGTSNGISAIWMALALRKTDGKLITHEIDPDTAALARENFAAVGVADIITVVEGDAHEKAADLKGPIDLVFIDADKQGYLDYFQKAFSLVRPGGLICAHNMNPRMADPEFVKAITTNPDVETVFYMEGGAMSVTLKKR